MTNSETLMGWSPSARGSLFKSKQAVCKMPLSNINKRQDHFIYFQALILQHQHWPIIVISVIIIMGALTLTNCSRRARHCSSASLLAFGLSFSKLCQVGGYSQVIDEETEAQRRGSDLPE